MTEIIEVLAAAAEADEPEAVLEELSREEAFDTGEAFVVGIGGHGLASRFFRLAARTDRVDFDFVVPAFNALDDADRRAESLENVRTVCRLACLALAKKDWSDDVARIAAEWDGFGDAGLAWSVFNAEGETVRTGDDWGSVADLFADEPAEGLVRFDA